MAQRVHSRDRRQFRAAYIELWKNGELRGRVERAVAVLADQDHYGKIGRSVTLREMEDVFGWAAACGLKRIDGRCSPIQKQS